MGLYLSEKALSDLKLIDAKFPNPHVLTSKTASIQAEKEDNCKCIPRMPAPEPPEKIPYTPTTENKDKLRSMADKTI